ncbi:MAG TPA: hypothetical protein VES02_02475 [Dermatophilaceae bacterium]|nr:hypothetical protein [Dermatophilaceae bacterium]
MSKLENPRAFVVGQKELRVPLYSMWNTGLLFWVKGAYIGHSL